MKAQSLLLALLIATGSEAQNTVPVVLADNTVKIAASGNEMLYFGFARGDKISIHWNEIEGKELKKFEIAPLDAHPIFALTQNDHLAETNITVPATGIYTFRFTNSNILSGRTCKISIQRIPARNAPENFNSIVYRKTIVDTTYYQETIHNYSRIDTVATDIVSKTFKVHSRTNLNGNKNITDFKLPANTIAWSYYIGVDQEGQKVFEKASKMLASNSAAYLINVISGANPLAALALGLTSYLTQAQSGEDIQYCLTSAMGASYFLSGEKKYPVLKQGNVINDFAKMDPTDSTLAFCFANDNAVTPVTVLLKITAIQTKKVTSDKQILKMKTTPRKIFYLNN